MYYESGKSCGDAQLAKYVTLIDKCRGAQRGDMDEAAPDRPAPRQVSAVAGLERTEQRVQAHRPVPAIGNEGVALEKRVEGYLYPTPRICCAPHIRGYAEFRNMRSMMP